jgi:hypothetical protein
MTGDEVPNVMLQYRISKYDPSFRDAEGRYTRDEWIMAGQIGESFDGVVLTREEYQRVENAYVTVALGFLRESGVASLTVKGLENARARPIAFGEGSVLGLEPLAEVIRRLLREDFWCRLEGHDGFLHFGWDYYMHVGVPCPCPNSQQLANRLRLFVEELRSPYLDHLLIVRKVMSVGLGVPKGFDRDLM